MVARSRIEGTWKAYIASTDEWSHKDAIPEVLKHGTAVKEPIARYLFPYFKDLPYSK